MQTRKEEIEEIRQRVNATIGRRHATFKIRDWYDREYTLKLSRIDKFCCGREYLRYAFKRDSDKRALFSGEDFGASPLCKPLSVASALGLLSFLTLRPGDTDDEYFEGYTRRQMDWAESEDVEQLSCFCRDAKEAIGEE